MANEERVSLTVKPEARLPDSLVGRAMLLGPCRACGASSAAPQVVAFGAHGAWVFCSFAHATEHGFPWVKGADPGRAVPGS
ncbi:MAG TPA: hypothetical protein VMV33_17455 [Rhodocyclaceae bacterium]|nr:hypothetical protein [Rhodocyclaceae bacterium]